MRPVVYKIKGFLNVIKVWVLPAAQVKIKSYMSQKLDLIFKGRITRGAGKAPQISSQSFVAQYYYILFFIFSQYML